MYKGLTQVESDRFYLEDRDFVKRCYDSLPWRKSVNGHDTVVVPVDDPAHVLVDARCGRSAGYNRGSWHGIYVPHYWRKTVYEVGGFKVLFNGPTGFLLTAVCEGVVTDLPGTKGTRTKPVYRVKAVVKDRGTRVRCSESLAWTVDTSDHTIDQYWHRYYFTKGYKPMPPQIVADYLQDHDHTVWTDERVAHLRMTDWFDNK